MFLFHLNSLLKMKQVTIVLIAVVCFFLLTMKIEDANGNAVQAHPHAHRPKRAAGSNQHVGAHPHAHKSKRAAGSNPEKSASHANHNGTHHAHGTNAHTHN